MIEEGAGRGTFRHRQTRMGILLIFIDGIGIGTRGAHNPLDGLDGNLLGVFQGEDPRLPFDGKMVPTDTSLGIEGLPQSATGQTAILTGVNAPGLIGRHLSGYPSPRLKKALAEHSIYKQLAAVGRTSTFANAYTRAYFDSRPRHVSATTVAAQSAGLRLRLLEDLEAGEAVSHDFTNQHLIEMGYEVPPCEPGLAGERLASLSAGHDFTLYEHFITDRIGHLQDPALARRHLPKLAAFIEAALRASDLSRQTVIITSDHGNIEDLTTRSHTMNPVATMAFGRARDRILSRIRALTDIAPAIMDILAPASA